MKITKLIPLTSHEIPRNPLKSPKKSPLTSHEKSRAIKSHGKIPWNHQETPGDLLPALPAAQFFRLSRRRRHAGPHGRQGDAAAQAGEAQKGEPGKGTWGMMVNDG